MNKKNKKKANKQIRFVDGVAQVIEFEDSNDAVNSNNKKNKFIVKKLFICDMRHKWLGLGLFLPLVAVLQ